MTFDLCKRDSLFEGGGGWLAGVRRVTSVANRDLDDIRWILITYQTPKFTIIRFASELGYWEGFTRHGTVVYRAREEKKDWVWSKHLVIMYRMKYTKCEEIMLRFLFLFPLLHGWWWPFIWHVLWPYLGSYILLEWHFNSAVLMEV